MNHPVGKPKTAIIEGHANCGLCRHGWQPTSVCEDFFADTHVGSSCSIQEQFFIAVGHRIHRELCGASGGSFPEGRSHGLI